MRFTYWLLFAGFFLLSLLLYFPSLHGEFIMDDWGYITQNAWVTGAGSPLRFWTTLQQTDYWPLTYTFYWLFYRLFGENPYGYHVINLLLHALNGVLLFALARQFKIRWPIWVALLFLAHPLHVQTAAWIIQFKTLLSTALALACVLLYLPFVERQKFSWLGWSLVAFAAAVTAKTSVIFLPVVLLILPGGLPLRRRLLSLTPFFALALAGGLVTLWVNELNFLERQAYVFQMPWFERPLLMIQNLLFYLKSFFLPLSLAYLYPLSVPTMQTSGWFLLPAGILLLALTAGYIFLPAWRERRFYFFGYLILLFPCLGLVPIPNMKLSLVADHWAYLPDTFLALYLGCVFKVRDTRAMRLLLMLPVAVLSALTFRHAQTFATEEAFWLRARELNPHSAVAMYNLGTVYGKLNRVEESIEIYRRTVQADPEHYRAWFNLGRGYMLQREFEKAEECFLQAVNLNPHLETGYVALSKVYQTVGSPEEARKIVEKGIAINPGSAQLAARIKELNLRNSSGL